MIWHDFLEKGSFIAQIFLPFLTVFVIWVAYSQLGTSRKFELLKILEAEKVRDARRIVYFKLHETRPEKKDWWSDRDNPEFQVLEEAASTVCASFDIVGIIAKCGTRRFFSEEWSKSICWSYEALKDYIENRNPEGYHGYKALYKDAKIYRIRQL